MARAVQINPRLMAWARETAGLSLEEAAAKLGLKDTTKATAAEKLMQAEAGSRPVSQGTLQTTASVYRRPLVTFYLPQPPSRGERGEDFRTPAGGGGASPREEAMLDALVRDVRGRQQLLREVVLEDDDTRPLSFVASCQVSDGAAGVAAKIRAVLGVNIEDQRRPKDAGALFVLLRAAAERAGVYVLLLGDLGSYHSDIGEDVFRGIALADDITPFVVINDNDAQAARSFTLLHELAHLWVGASGVSGPLRGAAGNAVERFCNAVASEFLLPPGAIEKLTATSGADFGSAMVLTDQIAQTWNVSQGAVTYRLLVNGWISDEVAGDLFRAFSTRWRAQKERDRETREPEEGGPNFYVVRRSRLGAGLLDTVRRALRDNVLTHTKAARILGVAPTAVDQLLKERQRAA
jgi:Zn-dependent peptidase ImmA (M78 family)/transcriptional regulator with XRE-family HTH domain